MAEPFSAGLFLASILLGLPVLVVYGSLADPQIEIWHHLADTVLSDYVLNSIVLAVSVGLGSLIIGTLLAWVIVRYDFFARRILQWLVVLPLAMPAYIIAYTYTGMLDFAGPLQTWLRELFGWQYGDYWFPEIRSLGGAIVVMTLVLYPYVFMLARTAFSEQSRSLREASISMGVSGKQHFIKVAFPLARPALLTGAALAMMEAFADYGTVQYFGVNTFTTGIFRTWFGLGNQIAASQLAALLCTLVLILLMIEKWSRRQIRYYQPSQTKQNESRIVKTGFQSGALFVGCLIAPLLGFFLPVYQLLLWAIETSASRFSSDYLALLWNSFMLASIAAIVIVTLALLFAYGKRLVKNPMMTAQVQVVSMGYAIPGTVIAVGVLIPFSWADRMINSFTQAYLDWTPGLVLSGTLFALIFAYAVRFLAVALQNVESGLSRITPNMDNAGRSLGLKPRAVLTKIHLPILRASVLSAILLVFVDVLKELPATLILRPFNFDTLAVSAYQYASDERLVDAAMPALSIVFIGLAPVILLSMALDKSARRNS